MARRKETKAGQQKEKMTMPRFENIPRFALSLFFLPLISLSAEQKKRKKAHDEEHNPMTQSNTAATATCERHHQERDPQNTSTHINAHKHTPQYKHTTHTHTDT